MYTAFARALWMQGSNGRLVRYLDMPNTIPDIRDQHEHSDVAAILAGLPADHPARAAYAEAADTIRLTHLVPAEMVPGLKEAFLAGYRRMLQRQGNYFRP